MNFIIKAFLLASQRVAGSNSSTTQSESNVTRMAFQISEKFQKMFQQKRVAINEEVNLAKTERQLNLTSDQREDLIQKSLDNINKCYDIIGENAQSVREHIQTTVVEQTQQVAQHSDNINNIVQILNDIISKFT